MALDQFRILYDVNRGRIGNDPHSFGDRIPECDRAPEAMKNGSEAIIESALGHFSKELNCAILPRMLRWLRTTPLGSPKTRW